MNKDEINAIHDEFRRCGKNAKEWTRQCQMMLPKIRDEEVWKRKGFSSIYEYAAKLAGMSHASVDDALFVLDRIEDKPHLMRLAGERGINAIRPIVTIVTKETEEFWAGRAEEMSNNTLRVYVAEMRRGAGIPDEIESRDIPSQRIASQDEDMSNGVRQTASIYMKLEIEVIEKLKRMKGDRDWNELMKDLLNGKSEMCVTESRTVPVEAEKQPSVAGEEKPAPVNTGKRYVPREIQKYVTNRTSGLCVYPGCAKPYEILHHTKRFALDSTHDPDTIKPLCKAHERLAHKGLIKNEERQLVEFMTDEGGSLSEVGKVGEESCGTINWSLLAEPDTRNPKYEIDKKTNKYYMPKLE